MMHIYRDWKELPAHLRTRSYIQRGGRALSPDQPVVAKINVFNPHKGQLDTFNLYDIRECVWVESPAEIPVRKATAKTCQRCGYTEPVRKIYNSITIQADGLCRICSDHDWAKKWASQMLERNGLILDTETSDLNGEIIEMAIIDMAGNTLFNQRFNPLSPVADGAYAVHGLSNEVLAQYEAFPAFWGELRGLLLDADPAIIYNAEFDTKRLNHTCRVHNMPIIQFDVQCAMLAYARYKGEWNPKRGDYRWHKLTGGDHSALGDCLATLRLIEGMAGNG